MKILKTQNKNQSKSNIKRFFLSLFLKMGNAKLFLMSYGKAFYIVKAATEKDLAPYVFKLCDRIKRFLTD